MISVKIVGGFIFPAYSQSRELFPLGMGAIEDYDPPAKGPWWISGVLFGREAVSTDAA